MVALRIPRPVFEVLVFACFSLSGLASAVYQHRCSCLDRRTIRVSSRDIFCDT